MADREAFKSLASGPQMVCPYIPGYFQGWPAPFTPMLPLLMGTESLQLPAFVPGLFTAYRAITICCLLTWCQDL